MFRKFGLAALTNRACLVGSICASFVFAACSPKLDPADGPITHFRHPAEEKIVNAKLNERVNVLSANLKKSQVPTVPEDAGKYYVNNWDEYVKAKMPTLSDVESPDQYSARAIPLIQRQALLMLSAMPKAQRDKIIADDLADMKTLTLIEDNDRKLFYKSGGSNPFNSIRDSSESVDYANRLKPDAIKFDLEVITKALHGAPAEIHDEYLERVHRIAAENVWQQFAYAATWLQAGYLQGEDARKVEAIIDKAVKMKPLIPEGETQSLKDMREIGFEEEKILHQDAAN